MRFSDNGFYIEKYMKCANCGMLIYGQGTEKEPDRQNSPLLFGLVRGVGPAARRT